MNFETDAHQQIYEKVAGMLKDLFGEMVHPIDDRPAFHMQMGSTATLITVYPWGDDDANVEAAALVASGTELVPDLLHDLLHRNYMMRFGAFAISDGGGIYFQHGIVGSTLDKEELKASVLAVSTTADRLDDEIVSKWGGQRVQDL